MRCPECNSRMYQEEALVSRTTSPEEDDQFEVMWVCENPNCGYSESIESEEE